LGLSGDVHLFPGPIRNTYNNQKRPIPSATWISRETLPMDPHIWTVFGSAGLYDPLFRARLTVRITSAKYDQANQSVLAALVPAPGAILGQMANPKQIVTGWTNRHSPSSNRWGIYHHHRNLDVVFTALQHRELPVVKRLKNFVSLPGPRYAPWCSISDGA